MKKLKKKKASDRTKYMKWLMKCPYQWGLIDVTNHTTELLIYMGEKRRIK